MKAVMLMYDTLTRNYLPNYGCDFSVMPNFRRLAEKTVTFDEFYGGSMPCMPARRELHTGKYNFLHRGWGPLEPYDDSMPETLSGAGIYTHLATDHSHYWEDGGCTYHGRYSSWEGFRGQEGDRWVPQGEADMSLNTCSLNKKNISAVQHLANRTRIVEEEDMPSVQTVSAGIDFIDHYHDKDSWFLQIECFDPHEPFYVPDRFRKLYDCCDSRDAFNFPAYTPVDDKYTPEEIAALRKEYCALLSLCDEQLGRVLDTFDK
ncbi:MAG: sulfatase [Erysipelotrichaceae bacterium]|nr:sulfatase [Erysipelotrichaceae bacterium]